MKFLIWNQPNVSHLVAFDIIVLAKNSLPFESLTPTCKKHSTVLEEKMLLSKICHQCFYYDVSLTALPCSIIILVTFAL